MSHRQSPKGRRLNAFREMQAQVLEVNRLRVQIALRIAAIEAPQSQGVDQAMSGQA